MIGERFRKAKQVLALSGIAQLSEPEDFTGARDFVEVRFTR